MSSRTRQGRTGTTGSQGAPIRSPCHSTRPPRWAPTAQLGRLHCSTLSSAAVVLCRMKSGSFLSTGWFTMILAMELCEEICVFGMVSDSYCRCMGGSRGRRGVMRCPPMSHTQPILSHQGKEPLERALPLLREGTAGRVQDVPGARASPPRRPPLHHRESHLLPLGQEEEHHLHPPVLGRRVGRQPWGEVAGTLAAGQLSSCHDASLLCRCHG